VAVTNRTFCESRSGFKLLIEDSSRIFAKRLSRDYGWGTVGEISPFHSLTDFLPNAARVYEFFRKAPKFPPGRNLLESERSSFSDCPLRVQSLPDFLLTDAVPRSRLFQPQYRPTFAFRPRVEWSCSHGQSGQRAVRRIPLGTLSPATYANVNHLRQNELYRRFESFSLRQSVWAAENLRVNCPDIRDLCPFFAIPITSWTAENGLPRQRSASYPPFSLERLRPVRLSTGRKAKI
jgi:hypothetical protein